MRYQTAGKRLLDVTLAVAGLVLSGPLWLTLLISVSVVNRGNPFFGQLRSGRRGRVFRLLKFRTMTGQRDAKGQLLPDADRLTPVGSWLRRTSLDELPQLLNVIRGDMSLVGPRPLLVAYWPLYSPEQHRRHEGQPGLTGWAQVNGRNALTWDEKFALDTWYITNQSVALDLKILWLTVLKLSVRRSHNGAETGPMPRFMGTATL